ncbi:MAG: hypothetical protein CMM60_03180 [Rhodospirillaceae bacterium]|jgi:hypothetical protein|nr:hypothetical protein [Rhodospirillaceae bacterium]|tara:strand:- start:1519 stop:3081 length:1563 start_codon:yes stop_codon:yes gene_type:complete
MSDYHPSHNLNFVENVSPCKWLDIACRERRNGVETIAVQPLNQQTAPTVNKIAAELATGLIAFNVSGDVAVPPGVGMKEDGDPEVVLLLEENPDKLATALLSYVNQPDIRIIAPLTDLYWRNRPLFVISIPKSGTHLVFRLAEALGFGEGGICPDNPIAGHWYYVEHSNAHTPATKFFNDTVLRAPFGNRAHPFMRSPALFSYRNPLDVVVSEANYYHKDGKTPFAGYLDALSFDQRLSRLVDDTWLLGSIRDRVGMFAPWLDFPNVIPVSFEEMVGSAGGSTKQAQLKLVWSIMLKLQVPGSPEEIAGKISDRASPTFREGKAGTYAESFTADAQAKFEALPQDFMEDYGYGSFQNNPVLSTRTQEFLGRPLKLSKAEDYKTPFIAEAMYLGHNLVAYGGHFYGIDTALGPFDITKKTQDEMKDIPKAEDLVTLKMLIFASTKNEVVTAYSNSVGSFLGYNLYGQDNMLVAISKDFDDIKPDTANIRDKPGVICSRNYLHICVKIILHRLYSASTSWTK